MREGEVHMSEDSGRRQEGDDDGDVAMKHSSPSEEDETVVGE